MQTKKAFLKEAVKNFKTAGTVTPSSRYLIKNLLRNVDFSNSNIIVEFGPGNGIITKQILKKMDSKTTLICFEINEQFYNHLQNIKDERVIIINTSAENILTELKKININKVDYVISSIPFSLMPDEMVINIIKNTKKALKQNGLFLKFQYSLLVRKKLREVFSHKNVKTNFELANIPPAFIFKCKKE